MANLQNKPYKSDLKALIVKAKKQWAETQEFSRKSREAKLKMGDYLKELKNKVGHGNWIKTCKEININPETARRLMRFSDAYLKGVPEPTHNEIISHEEKESIELNSHNKVQVKNSQIPQVVGNGISKVEPNHNWCPLGKCEFEERDLFGFKASVCKKCMQQNPDGRFKKNRLGKYIIEPEKYKRCPSCGYIDKFSAFPKLTFYRKSA